MKSCAVWLICCTLVSCQTGPSAPPPPERSVAEILDLAVIAAGAGADQPIARLVRVADVTLHLSPSSTISGTETATMDGARQRFELVRSDGHSEIEIVTSDTFRAWQDGVETRRTINATGRRVRQAHSILAEFHRRSDEVEQLAAEVLRDHDHASYVLSLTFSDTERWQLWIDATTGETLRVLCNTVAGGEPTLYEEWWFDHQLCGQRRVAHRIVTLNNGRVLKESTLRSWDEDPEIPPDAFDQP